MSLIREKYKPEYLSELEDEHPDIINTLINGDSLCIYGKAGVGKTTIIKTILKHLNFDYVYIDSYDKNDDINKKINKRTIKSYFYNIRSVVVYDNFDYKLYRKTSLQCIYILDRKIKGLKNFFINQPTNDYLNCLKYSILHLEELDVEISYDHNNYHVFFSELECAISTNRNTFIDYKFNIKNTNLYIQLFGDISIEEKFKIAEQIHDYSYFQNNYLNYISTIELAAEAMDFISLSTLYKNGVYYSCFNLIAPSFFMKK
tara:strand:- start:708 stop:1484 length:777 start_codon:yes stop_codon:yes gene_type:complete